MHIVKQKNILLYLKGYFHQISPAISYKKKERSLLKKISKEELNLIEKRVHYYCKYSPKNINTSRQHKVSDLKKPKSPKAYYFDTYEYARFFNGSLPIDFDFGDVTHIPNMPSIVKSRPIGNNNQNSVVLNLDKTRHFTWVRNDQEFSKKKDLLIGRGAIFKHQPHRISFYQKYFNHPMCNLGQTNSHVDFGWLKPKIPISEHLDYKFILSLEGNDVATNLKWIMSSNSIAVMPKPTYETWFMEGKLQGGIHYIELKKDYSNLEEQLNYYINHPEECTKIIQNAHNHCNQFYNKNIEDLCSILVLKKYFNLK